MPRQGRKTRGIPTVVFGLDLAGTPHAARFGRTQFEAALAAAHKNGFEVFEPTSPQMRKAVQRVPPGRITRASTIIPPIDQATYNDLYVAFGGPVRDGLVPDPTGLSQHADAPAKYPKTWEAIGTGATVLVPSGPRAGWWEATVVSRDGLVLTLKYRDFPKLPKRVLDIHCVALLSPAAS